MEYRIEEQSNGCVAVYLGELERMNALQQCLCIRLYAERSCIELEGRIFNTSPLPQTFLWWANPAVKAGDGHQSIFPPDVNVVCDHGKRDVSRFPIATGKYYKADYSAGVDISRYKNIPVPTSYMAWRSNYNFVGAYDHDENGGLLHVANHHIAPGKKQWTWGHGNFGQVWDRNLTDEDGPYIELMTGIYTDNQPDFTWLEPYEEKRFMQYFMPYRELGQVHNASERLVLKCGIVEGKSSFHDVGKIVIELGIQAFGPENVTIKVYDKRTSPPNELYRESLQLGPADIWQKNISFYENLKESEIYVCLLDDEQNIVLEYQGREWQLEELPEPPTSPAPPNEIKNCDELFYIGQHIEQYRNPSMNAEDYYREILQRDSLDCRANLAMGRLELHACSYEKSLKYLDNALQRQMSRNTNPRDGEISYLRGLALLHLDRLQEAEIAFYKSSWSYNYKAQALYYIAVLHARRQQWYEGLTVLQQALDEQGLNWEAQSLKLYFLRKIPHSEKSSLKRRELLRWIKQRQPLHMVSLAEEYLGEHCRLDGDFANMLRCDSHNLLSTAYTYSFWGANEIAAQLGVLVPANSDPMQYYAVAYFADKQGQTYQHLLEQGEISHNFSHFPNKEYDYHVLCFVLKQPGMEKSLANYHLGNFLYDRKRYEEAFTHWQQLPHYMPAQRNRSIYLYNKQNNKEEALCEIQAIIARASSEAHGAVVVSPRILFEYSYLLRMSHCDAKIRKKLLQDFVEFFTQRDDLFTEYMQIQLLLAEYDQVLAGIASREFHPWEGGEGKVGRCFIMASIGSAIENLLAKEFDKAISLLENSLVYPANINEGRLINQTDNDIYYWLGMSYDLQQDGEKARQFWQLAAQGESEISITAYYNDVPLDYIFYQAQALRKLGAMGNANRLCHQLIDFGERNIKQVPKKDFFAVSMPDFNVYEIDWKQEFYEQCLFGLYLGFTALEDRERSQRFQMELLSENPNHLGVTMLSNYLRIIDEHALKV